MGAAALIRGPLGVTVQEALESVLSPALAEQVITDVLTQIGRPSFPEDPTTAAKVIRGPLRELIADLFGADTSLFVVQALDPVLAVASSGVRERPTLPETDRPAGNDPYASPTRPVLVDDHSAGLSLDVQLLVASADPSLPPELTGTLGASTEVALVHDALELFTRIETRTSPVWIVVDGYRPSVDVQTLAMFLGSLPPECRVLLWGCDSPTARRLVEARPQVWSFLEASERWAEASVVLRALLADY